MKELIIFDLDGTLVDTENDIVFSLNQALADFNLTPRKNDEIRKFIGPGIDVLYDHVLDGTATNRNEFNAAFKKYYKENLDKESRLYDGIHDLLKNLNEKNVKMAVLTNKPTAPAQELCKLLKINTFFTDIIGPDSFGAYKPDPTSILYLLHKFKLQKEAAIMIGDGTPDILAAKSARIDSIGVTYGYKDLQTIINLQPTYVINTIAELESLINEKLLII